MTVTQMKVTMNWDFGDLGEIPTKADERALLWQVFAGVCLKQKVGRDLKTCMVGNKQRSIGRVSKSMLQLLDILLAF